MNSITEPSAPAPNLDFPTLPPAEPRPEPKHLPADLEVKNKSQAQRLARHFFGPLARVTMNDIEDGNVTIRVDGQLVGGSIKGDFKQALENALVLQASGELKVPGLMQDSAINTVLRRRYDLLGKLPHHYQKDEQQGIVQGIFGARDHELFEIEKLTKATSEGPMLFREYAAKDLKKLLDACSKRFQAEQKKRNRS